MGNPLRTVIEVSPYNLLLSKLNKTKAIDFSQIFLFENGV